MSSSLLALGTHKIHHPDVHYIESRRVQTQTGRRFVDLNKIPIDTCNFWNLDIKGKELDVLKSMGDLIEHAEGIYTEVNTEEVYEGGALLSEIDTFLKDFDRVELTMTDCGWGDAFYVRRSRTSEM